MTGNPSSILNSTLPMSARNARIAAGGGLASCAPGSAPDMRRGNALADRPDPDMPGRVDDTSGGRLRSPSVLETQPNETIHHN